MRLPKHHVGAGILLSVLHIQRNNAANYMRPVWMCPCAPSTVAVDGVLSSVAKGSPASFYSLRGVYREPAKGAVEAPISILLLLGGGVGRKEQAVSWQRVG